MDARSIAVVSRELSRAELCCATCGRFRGILQGFFYLLLLLFASPGIGHNTMCSLSARWQAFACAHCRSGLLVIEVEK